MPDGNPCRGYVAYPKGAAPGSLPIYLFVHSAGVNRPANRSTASFVISRARQGYLCLDINAHGFLDDQPQSYYDAINSGELDNYASRAFTGIADYYFHNMYPELKGEIGSWELAKDLENKTIDDLKAGFTDAVGKFSSLEELKNAQNSANQETQSSYRIVEELANRYGMTVDALIAKIQKLGGLPIDFKVNQGAVANFSKAMNRGGYTYNEGESNALDQAISQSKYQSQINTFGDAYWDQIAAAINEAHEKNNGLALSQQQLKNVVDETTEAYIKEQDAVKEIEVKAEFDEDSFAESMKQLKNLQSLYTKFAEAK